MILAQRHQLLGAVVAADGIPQHFGDPRAEYDTALNAAVLLDRSHEARLRLDGDDRYVLIQRISTNDVLNLTPGQGCATVFTNPTGRVLDRTEVYAQADHALLVGGPGRAEALRAYIQQNIFFRDKVRQTDLTPVTSMFGLHGPRAEAVIEAIVPGTAALPLHGHLTAQIGGVEAVIMRAKPLSGAHFRVIVSADAAVSAWDAIITVGGDHGLRPGGALLYNALRIRAGLPGAGRELSADYIPLELGLWDEISFTKGCYTGQEIIARMESRGKLAKTIVTLRLAAPSDSPVDLLHEGKRVGTLSSAVTSPDDVHYGIGIIKPNVAQIGTALVTASGVSAEVTDLPGAQPPV